MTFSDDDRKTLTPFYEEAHVCEGHDWFSIKMICMRPAFSRTWLWQPPFYNSLQSVWISWMLLLSDFQVNFTWNFSNVFKLTNGNCFDRDFQRSIWRRHRQFPNTSRPIPEKPKVQQSRRINDFTGCATSFNYTQT